MAFSQVKTTQGFHLATTLLSVASLLLLTSCATVTSDWSHARQQDTIGDYQRFLEKYPDAEFTQVARQQIERLRYQQAIQKDQVALYFDFMGDYPSSSYLPDIRERFDVKKSALRQLPPIESVAIKLTHVTQEPCPEQSVMEFLVDSLRRKNLTVLTEKIETPDITVSIGELLGVMPAGIGIFSLEGSLEGGRLQPTGVNAFYQVPISIYHRTGGPIYIEKTVESDTMYGPMWGGEVETKRLNSLKHKALEATLECFKTYFRLSEK